jgi:solute:Na+ symporter, SSS family
MTETEPIVRSLSSWDYFIIVCYFLFVASIGFMFRRFNRNTSDYFRGGGNMVWWVAGMSVMAAGISTWTFTGGAAKCYKDGFVLPLTYWLGALPTLIVMLAVAPRLRRFRVITAMEAIFRRFGLGTEQLFTWTMLPLGLFFGGVGLNTLAVFMGSVFGAEVGPTILISGLIVTLMATLGGQWGVAAGAFVQGLMMFLIVIVVVVFSVNLPEIGGVTNLLNVLPERHTRFDTEVRLELVWLWIGWQTFGAFLGPLDMRNSGKFVRVKDDSHARRMVLLLVLPNLLFLMPLWMQLPAMCAAVVFPDMHALFPNLKYPEEAAWVAMSFKVLPQGLMGVMVCGMFAAALDTLDAGLNTNAGFFVKNVYARYLKPDATDKQQLICGKVFTVIFGILMIIIGLKVNEFRSMNLFDFLQKINAILLAPMGVPMILGLIVRRAPSWAGWSTVIVGMIVSISADQFYSAEVVQRLFGYESPLNARENIDTNFVFIGVATLVISSGWFMLTTLFYPRCPAAERERIDTLFADLARPIDRKAEGAEDQDIMQYQMIGGLSLAMGTFFLLCMLIPNEIHGRLAFGFIGGTIAGIGLLLWVIYLRKARLLRETLAAEASATATEP